MFLKSCLIVCCGFIFADTGIGISVGFTDNQKSILLDTSSKYKMDSNTSYSLCFSAANWRKLSTNVFVGGDINIGFIKKTLTYKDDKIDCKIKNDNINFEVFTKLGFGNNKLRVYLAPGICFTKFTPEISYKTIDSGVATMKNVKFEQKNLLTPFFAFKSGLFISVNQKVSFDVGYTVAIANKQKLESDSFSDPLSSFDKKFFKFGPAISRVSIGCHYRVN